MAKSTKKKTSKKVDPTNISHEGTLKLSDILRLTLLRYEAEVRASDGEIRLHVGSLESYIKSIDPEGKITKMQSEIQALVHNRDLIKKKYQDTLKEIESELGISMSDFSFDTETGILHKNPTELSPSTN